MNLPENFWTMGFCSFLPQMGVESLSFIGFLYALYIVPGALLR